jgi:Tol biopolymer transport system component
MEAVPGFSRGKHVNPQWATDGKRLFFVSDRNGISNLYHVRLADGHLTQVTNLYTGISGITPTGPAVTVARDRAVITVHAHGRTHLQLINDPALLGGRAMVPEFAGVDPARLPPAG